MHKPDAPRLVSKWRADGNLTGMTFGSSEENQPMVMKRHLLESKSLRFHRRALSGGEGALREEATA